MFKPDGFAEIRVPDIALLMRTVVEKDLDLLDVIYQSPAGPVRVRDVLFMVSARRSSAPARISMLTNRIQPRSPSRSPSEKVPLRTRSFCAAILRSAAMPSSRRRKYSQLEALGLRSLARASLDGPPACRRAASDHMPLALFGSDIRPYALANSAALDAAGSLQAFAEGIHIARMRAPFTP